MQFAGKLNAAEIREATRMIRPKGYAKRNALIWLRLALYVAIVGFLLAQSFLRHQHIPVQVIAIRVLLLVVVGGLFVYRVQKSTRDQVRKLDAALPDSLVLGAEGVRLDGPFGAQSFQPWASYRAYREGTHVFVLDRTEPDLFNVVPVSALGPGEREKLRDILRTSIPGGALPLR